MIRTHGGDIYPFDSNVIDFSININPLGIRNEIRAAAISAIGDMDKYPDLRQEKLRVAIGNMEGVDKDLIICGNGASEIIFGLVSALKPKKALLISPSFTEYEIAVDSVDTVKDFYLLKEEEEFLVKEDILDKINNDTDMVFICNPNNPTGKLVERELLLKILEKCKETGTHLIIDESFMSFSERYKKCTMVPFADKYKNLIIHKSFTKMYSFPGLRLGYGILKDMNVMERLEKVRPPWAVSNIAEQAGITACSIKKHPENTRSFIKREKNKFYLKLSMLEDKGIRFFESETNFILFYAPDVNKENLYDLLLKRDMLIRRCSDFRGLNGSWYRLSVNTEAYNKLLMDAIKEIYMTQ